ncbi:hypothetical protein KIH39_12120 [Telmatocola sphagniphila]|uniref:Uncharacterized protein n=1 Tax=Telmatocola sphagniphila TaxID=1123043 RepID=A0A8E6BA00_9BACT|nr:hypothetical protein [Telmatocola sphagniphila]QVL34617.1 hypothetical protein KIH39_12120 [Telmatocola sphagniphila]
MMRYSATLLILASLSLWAGAQSPKSRPRVDEQLKLFERNQVMIEKLIDGSLQISRSRDALSKSKAYEEILKEMQQEIKLAAAGQETSRLKELVTHLGTVLLQGLVPNLENARKSIAPGSQDEKALYAVKNSTGDVVNSVLKSIPENFEGKDARKKIQDARDFVDAVK